MAVRNRETIAALDLIKRDLQREMLSRRGTMTYDQLTKASGMSVSEISRILNGRLTKFRAEHMLNIAIRMGMKPRVVFGSHNIDITDQAGELRKFSEIETETILTAFAICNGNAQKTARDLGIGHNTVYRRVRAAAKA